MRIGNGPAAVWEYETGKEPMCRNACEGAGVERSPSQKNCGNEQMRETSMNAPHARFFACALISATLGIPSVFAADSASVQNLGTSEILSGLKEAPFTESPDFITIDSKAWEGKSLSAGELLSKEAGIQLQKLGGMGSFETVSVRGASAKTVLICIDGIPVQDAGGGAVSLGGMDLNQFERVEIYKNYAPAKFGGNAIGGVINFVSKPEASNRNRLLASYGSHNSYELSYALTHKLSDRFKLSSQAGFRHSDNDYEYLDRNDTKYNTEDDTVRTRQNADYSQFSGTHSLRYMHSGHSFSSWIITHSNEWGGNPGKENNQTYVAGFENSLLQAKYLWESPYTDAWRLEAGAAGKVEKAVSHSYFPLDRLGYTYNGYMEYGAISYTARPELRLLFEPFLCPYKIHGGLHLTGDFERVENRDNNQIASRYDWHLEKAQGDLAAEFGISPNSLLTFDLNLSGRGDYIHRSRGVLFNAVNRDTLPSAKKKHLYWAARTAALFGKEEWPVQGFASVARYFRAPQMLELYGVYQNVLSNPNLKAETGLNWEVGFRFAENRFKNTLQVLYFETRSKDGITWVTSGSLVKPLNMDEALTRGIEFEWSNRTFRFLDLSFKGTVQNPRDLSSAKYYNDKYLPNEPVFSEHLICTWHLPFQIDLTGELHYRSKTYCDRANKESVDSETLLHASVSKTFKTKTRFTFAVNNITDEDHQNIYDSYPKPGREYKATIIQDF